MRLTAVALVLAATVAVVIVPLLVMGRTVWVEGAGRLEDILHSAELARAVSHTFLLALAVTAGSVPLGTALALALRRPDLPGRSFWRLAVLLPVLVPDFVLGYSWVRAYGRSGLTDDVVGLSWSGVQGAAGVTAVVLVNAVPLAYLMTAVGLAARAEPDAERAAQVSGAGPLAVLGTITLPLLRPAIVTAAALVFVLTLGTFAIPLVMGTPSGFSTVSTRIYASIARSSDPTAFVEAIALALLLVVVAALVIAPVDLVLGPRLRATRVASTDPMSSMPPSATAWWLMAGIAGYVVVSLGLPLLALVTTAMTRAVGLPPTPANWTLDNFASVLTVRNGAALGRSLLLAAVAATLLVLLGGCVAGLQRSWAGRGLASLVTLTLVLPGSTLGVGLLISYGRWLGGTLAIIMLAYVAKLWAVAHRMSCTRPASVAPVRWSPSGPWSCDHWRRLCWVPGWSAS